MRRTAVKRVDERLGHHEIAEPQPRQQHLAEGAREDHAAVRIEPLQRRKRAALVTKLAVVVVLEDEALARRGPCEEREAPGQAQRHAERQLACGRHEREPRVRAARDAGGDVDAFAIDGHRHQPRARRDEGAGRAEIAGILHPHRVARIEQRPCREIHALLRAGSDNHLAAAAAHAARCGQVRGDRRAQLGQAARIAVGERRGRRGPPAARREPSPERHRKNVECRDAGAKGARRPARNRRETRRRGRDEPGAARSRRRLPARLHCGNRLGPRSGADGALWKRRRHARRTAREAVDVTLRAQQVVGQHRRLARDRQLLRQLARRRQPLAGAETAGEDGVAEVFVDLPVQRRPEPPVEAREERRHQVLRRATPSRLPRRPTDRRWPAVPRPARCGGRRARR